MPATITLTLTDAEADALARIFDEVRISPFYVQSADYRYFVNDTVDRITAQIAAARGAAEAGVTP